MTKKTSLLLDISNLYLKWRINHLALLLLFLFGCKTSNRDVLNRSSLEMFFVKNYKQKIWNKKVLIIPMSGCHACIESTLTFVNENLPKMDSAKVLVFITQTSDGAIAGTFAFENIRESTIALLDKNNVFPLSIEVLSIPYLLTFKQDKLIDINEYSVDKPSTLYNKLLTVTN